MYRKRRILLLVWIGVLTILGAFPALAAKPEMDDAQKAAAALTQEHSELMVLKEFAAAKQQTVELLLKEKISEYQNDIEDQEAKIKSIEAEMQRKVEEARKQAEQAGQSYTTASLGNINFTWPCPSSSRITSRFGARKSPVKGASSNHQGLDIGAPTGTPIVAAADGTVSIAAYSHSSGNHVMINHGGGIYTVYLHCASLGVSEGQAVSKGQTIAAVGSTGYSTGPHLHFGIRVAGNYVDPEKYVSFGS